MNIFKIILIIKMNFNQKIKFGLIIKIVTIMKNQKKKGENKIYYK